MSHKADLGKLERMYQKANCPALPFGLERQICKEACASAIYNQWPTISAELRELRELAVLQNRVSDALGGILGIGKRDTSNPKYDGYYEEAYEARAAARKWEAENV